MIYVHNNPLQFMSLTTLHAQRHLTASDANEICHDTRIPLLEESTECNNSGETIIRQTR